MLVSCHGLPIGLSVVGNYYKDILSSNSCVTSSWIFDVKTCTATVTWQQMKPSSSMAVFEGSNTQ